jgi:hypothetical protein
MKRSKKEKNKRTEPSGFLEKRYPDRLPDIRIWIQDQPGLGAAAIIGAGPDLTLARLTVLAYFHCQWTAQTLGIPLKELLAWLMEAPDA